MAIDARTFRQTAGHFATGVTVISLVPGAAGNRADGALEDDVRAMTVNSFTSVSLDPPLVLVCLGKDSRAGKHIQTATRFCVSILGDNQRDLSAYFAGAWKAPVPPRVSFTDWDGVPRLDGSIAAIGCHVYAVHDGGDHWIVVGEVVGTYKAEHECRPLVFYSGGYVDLEAPCVRLDDAPAGIDWGPWG